MMKLPKNSYFITGTDTGVGKTYVTCALLKALRQQGYTTAAMKPVASGCEWTAAGWRNQDALLLQQQASLAMDYASVNPFALEQGTSPHIAADCAGVQLSTQQIVQKIAAFNKESVDYFLVEGIGGWLVPINVSETMADVAQALNFPVILVVAIRLGCFNHALLSYRAMLASGVPIVGWVANRIDPSMPYTDEAVNSLQQYLHCPLITDIAYERRRLGPGPTIS